MSSSAIPRAVVRRVAVFTVLLATFFVLHANWRSPVLRLDAPLANRLVLLVAFTLPAIAFGVVSSCVRGWRWAAAAVAMLPLLAYTVIMGVIFAFDLLIDAPAIARGHDSAFALIRTHDVGGSRLAVYRTNCGATCSFDLVLRHERPLVPGLLLVRELGRWSRAYDATLRTTDAGTVHFRIPPNSRYPAAVARDTIVRPRPWVYF